MTKSDLPYHEPVLLQESVNGLDIKKNGVYVDVTFGGGGHSTEILERLGEGGKLYAFDQDEDALQNALQDARFQLINENFQYLKQFLKFYGIFEVDGILADFGVSSYQFDQPERGFSTRFDAALDMRMQQKNTLSAFEVVNTYSEADLARIFSEFGELRSAKGMARVLTDSRKQAPIRTTGQLKEALARFFPKAKAHKILAQVYQAIRIEVNQEIEVLKSFLLQVPEVLKKEGRLSMISYHSLEDRLAKRFIRSGKFEGEPEKDFYGNPQVPLKKVGGLIVPSTEEITRNNRARSAKLRIAERI